MLLVAHGLDFDDAPFTLDENIIKNAEVLDAKHPVKQLVLAEALSVRVSVVGSRASCSSTASKMILCSYYLKARTWSAAVGVNPISKFYIAPTRLPEDVFSLSVYGSMQDTARARPARSSLLA
jgi:hypothetical protein